MASYDPVAWKHKTNKGRVVYDRPTKSFTLRDIQRVTKKALAEETLEGDPDTWYWLVWNLLNDMTIAIGEWISKQFFEGKITGPQMQRICLDAIGILLRLGGIDVDGINKAIGDFLRGLDAPKPVPVEARAQLQDTECEKWLQRYRRWVDRWKSDHFGQPPSPSDIARYGPKAPEGKDCSGGY